MIQYVVCVCVCVVFIEFSFLLLLSFQMKIKQSFALLLSTATGINFLFLPVGIRSVNQFDSMNDNHFCHYWMVAKKLAFLPCIFFSVNFYWFCLSISGQLFDTKMATFLSITLYLFYFLS